MLKMSTAVSLSNWLLQYLLKETAEKLPETACSNIKASFPETQLVKVMQVLLICVMTSSSSSLSGPVLVQYRYSGNGAACLGSATVLTSLL